MIEAYKVALLQPVKITSEFGKRKDPVTGKEGAMHYGLDLISKNNNSKKEVFAVADGVVLSTVTNQSSATTGYGNRIWIRHKDLGWSSFYAHLEKVNVKKGDTVKQGQIIGIEGKTGKSSGIHLHFGVQYIGNSTWQNPINFKVPNNNTDIIIQPTSRDENKAQLKVLSGNVEVRRYPDTNSDIRGYAKQDGIYDIKGTARNHGEWYQIDDIQWVANKDIEVLPIKDNGNIEELKKELAAANLKIQELTLKVTEQESKINNMQTINEALQKENKDLLEDLESYKLIYTCERTGKKRITIKLNAGDTLYKKGGENEYN